jgi:hypothetical protein
MGDEFREARRDNGTARRSRASAPDFRVLRRLHAMRDCEIDFIDRAPDLQRFACLSIAGYGGINLP